MFSYRKLSVIGWDEFLRQISVLIILNRSNYDLRTNQPRRASIPKININLTSNSINVNNVPKPSVTISPDFFANESFRKHGKILEKLNTRAQEEKYRRKQMGSLVDWSIVESIDEEEKFQLPKLKPNARDERQTISEPWSIVRDMQQLRNQPLIVTTTRYHMLNV